MEIISRNTNRSLWSRSYVNWVFLASIGASGRVLVMWDRKVVDKMWRNQVVASNDEFPGMYF